MPVQGAPGAGCRPPRGYGTLYGGGSGKGSSVDGEEFSFWCGWCEEENVLWGVRAGFWGNKFEVDSEWYCIECRGLNYTHEPPWTRTSDVS